MYDEKHMSEQCDSYRKAESDERIMNTRAEIQAIKKHYGEKVKITGNMILGRGQNVIEREVERQYAEMAKARKETSE